MNTLVATYAARGVAAMPGKGRLYYARRKAVQCLRSGWTREQVMAPTFDYGWLRSLDKSGRRPLSQLVNAERRVISRVGGSA